MSPTDYILLIISVLSSISIMLNYRIDSKLTAMELRITRAIEEKYATKEQLTDLSDRLRYVENRTSYNLTTKG